MQVTRRDIWLADLGEPTGSTAGDIRPIVIVQNDSLNVSRLTTYLAIPLTSNLRRQAVPWNLFLPAKSTGLEKDSVAQPTLTLAVDEVQLIERIGRVSEKHLDQLFSRLDIALGRAGVA